MHSDVVGNSCRALIKRHAFPQAIMVSHQHMCSASLLQLPLKDALGRPRPFVLAAREFHETCHFSCILFHEKRLQTMLWHHNAGVNGHQRWKQTRLRICFHLWCELTSTMNVTEWQVSWNPYRWLNDAEICGKINDWVMCCLPCNQVLSWPWHFLKVILRSH